MPQPVRSLAFGALVLGAVGALASCAADSTTSSTLAPMQVPSTTAFATMPPVTAPPTTLPGETTTVPPGAPVEYVVQSGDYLFGIATAHGVDVNDIVTLNGWSSVNESLMPGETILVPAPAGGAPITTAPPTGATTAPTGAATTAPPSGATTTTAAPGGGATSTTAASVPEGSQEYTVKNNDTVYGIARKFGITPQELVDANGWADVNHALYPGATIIVPVAA